MIHPMLNIAIEAARKASRVILRYLDQLDKIEITEKNQNDFVTQVDNLSEEIIITEIQKAYPRHTFLAEESGKNKKNHDYCWIIDPLDGTRNFMQGYPQFAISIAVAKKNVIELGLIYDPVRQELFTATRGKGAYLNNRRIRTSHTNKMQQALIGTGFPYRHKENLSQYLPVFTKVLSHCSDIRRAGSAALDLAYVACGRLDGFWESGLQIWDMAAGSIMIQEAGGIVTDFTQQENYLETGNILAGNVKIHKELGKLIR